ncbi:hypothetical protein KS4_31270 [Poriferisphaera corsica]|uniref:Uncharacterized protein n=1 Tax=Poriferisphaera corsica TaxID=2528020 RepID=A0A517YXU1_9BACT|nr:hypothetical protein [Poriferisphaera corsica]QDU35050.1 hypothetical protein KS4_31270 [Poriferisphaera corsica]
MPLEKAKHENRDMNVGVLVTIVIAGVMLILIIFVGMIAWIQTEIGYIRQERVVEVPNEVLESLRSEQLANITTTGKDAQGNDHIPIDVAMKLVVDRK